MFIDKANLAVDGAAFLSCAIKSGNHQIVDMLLKKGISSTAPPGTVFPSPSDPSFQKNYRKTPYLIQAAQ